jgi:hypothetical protein
MGKSETLSGAKRRLLNLEFLPGMAGRTARPVSLPLQFHKDFVTDAGLPVRWCVCRVVRQVAHHCISFGCEFSLSYYNLRQY